MENVVSALGAEASWWSNAKYPSWAWGHGEFSDEFTSNPVTGHTFDCTLIGIGAFSITFLAYGDS